MRLASEYAEKNDRGRHSAISAVAKSSRKMAEKFKDVEITLWEWFFLMIF